MTSSLAGTLFVVATPIGNLEDITLRAIKVLKSVQLVAAEDTRRTGILLRHFGINVSILSVHEHNEGARTQKITARLAKGESVALVTDAGTPGVSDPGSALVAAVRAEGFRIEPIPGASAVATAISVAGINTDGFTFLGFPPVRGKDRRRWFESLIQRVPFANIIYGSARQLLDILLADVDMDTLVVDAGNRAGRQDLVGREEETLANDH